MATKTAESTITLIGRLLRQAESTTHPEEAATFAARAQSLATRHSIDLAVAQSRLAATEERQHPEQRTIDVDGSSRARAHYVRLYLAIAGANDVRCYISSNSATVYATGFASDLDVVDALYSTLVVHMASTCTAYIKSGQHRTEVVERHDPARGRWTCKPVHGATARADFYRAYASRIRVRLTDAAQEAEAALSTPEDGPPNVGGGDRALVSTALVLREKRSEVEEVHKDYGAEIGASGSYRGGRRARGRATVRSAVVSGSAAAASASLVPPQAPRGSLPSGA